MNKIRKKIKELNDLVSLSFHDLQSFEVLKDWPVKEERLLNGSWCKKISQTDNLIRFLTVIPPKGSFLNHWHDCQETCIVLEGCLSDEYIEKGKKWEVGENYTVGEMLMHKPFNPSSDRKTKLIVEFYKK